MQPELTREELRAKTHMLNPAMWVLDNEFINENQKPFEFDKHRFMLQPYADSSPDQVIMKSAQVGWSVAAILKSIHAANFLKLNIIYVLPTRNVVNDFVRPKVNPMIERNPVIRKMVKGSDSVSLKEVGDRWIYFRGSFHEGEAISTTADLIVADEYDRSDQGVLTVYQSRLQASEYGWFWRFSNPSVPGFGVHELYQNSDQMHWFVTCHACGHEWFMEYEANGNSHYVDEERRVYACGKCAEPLTDRDRQRGRWIPRYPSRGPKWDKDSEKMEGRRGYWLSQLMIPWVSAKKIIQQKESMSIEVFHNFVLGLPYQASEFLINRESILRACVPALAEKRDVIIGCDSGKEKHWIMGNPSGVFAYGKTNDWSDIERLITMYDATCVIDALPDFTVPEALARKYPGKVYVHYYSPDNSASMDVSRRKEGVDFGVLQSDRTKLFDVLAADVTSGKMRFFQQPKDLEDLIYHVEQIYRVVEPDTRGIMKAKWLTKDNKPDHWAHALAYFRVGQSFSLGPDSAGGVRPNQSARTSGIIVDNKTNTTSVRSALGMSYETLVERSLAKNKKVRVK